MAVRTAERLAYFAVDSRNKIGENGFAIKPSQDGEDKIFENRRGSTWYLVLGTWLKALGSLAIGDPSATSRQIGS